MGRPHQPYCPDCIKAGLGEVPKAKGVGYCKPHHLMRQAAYRQVRITTPEGQTPTKEAFEQGIVDFLRADNAQLKQRVANLELMITRYEEEGIDVRQEERLQALQDENLALRQWKSRATAHMNDPEEYPHPDAKDQRSRMMRLAEELNAQIDAETPPSE